MGLPRFVERSLLGWRPAGGAPGGFGLRRFRIQVGEDLLDDVGIFETLGDDPHCPVAGRAGLDIDAKDLLEALRPAHRGAAYSGVRYRRKKNS